MIDLLIDGNSLFARGWFATLHTGDPEAPVRAGLISVCSLLDVNKEKLRERPDRMLVAWDGPGHDAKGRPPKDPNYHPTRAAFKRFLHFLLSPAQVELDGVEADDVLATAVDQSRASSIYVVSGDKDLQQLAGGKVFFYCLKDKSLLSERAICARWHVRHPSQVALALAILGDKTDRIPGVPGWGPVKVRQLFESMDAGLSFVEAFRVIEAQVPPQLRHVFQAAVDQTYLNRELKGVPKPAPIRAASLEMLKTLGLLQVPEFMPHFRPIYRVYPSSERQNRNGPAGRSIPVTRH
jgi:5'-3' exonuclease